MNTVEKIKELKQLLDEGILSQDEFDTEKRKLIGVPKIEPEIDPKNEIELKSIPDTDDKKDSHINKQALDELDNSSAEVNLEPAIDSSEALDKPNGLKEQLEEFKTMFDSGLISEDEYKNMRSETLNSKPEVSHQASNKHVSNSTNNSSNQKIILMVVGGILLAILLFVGVGFATQTTQEKLSENVEKAVKNSDSKALLKNFSKDNQDAVWALPGASMLVYNWRDETPGQIVNELAADEDINNYDDYSDVNVTVQSKSHMIFWKTYYLETKNTQITAESGEKNEVTLKANADDDDLTHLDTNSKKEADKKVSVDDMSKRGVFPGWWSFSIESPSGSTVSSDAFIKAYGEGDTSISMDFE